MKQVETKVSSDKGRGIMLSSAKFRSRLKSETKSKHNDKLFERLRDPGVF